MGNPDLAIVERETKERITRVKDTRQALGLAQAELAERLGGSPSYVSAVESGRRNLTLGQLANIANAMRLGDQDLVYPARMDGVAEPGEIGSRQA